MTIEDRGTGATRTPCRNPSRRSSISENVPTIAVAQGALLVLVAPLVGIPLHPGSMGLAMVALFLIAFAFNALGFVLAWRMESIQGFHGIVNLILMPMWFLSGALFPVAGAARGLEIAMRANPVTYGLAAFRESLYGSSVAGPVASESAWLVTIAFAATAFALAVAVARR